MKEKLLFSLFFILCSVGYLTISAKAQSKENTLISANTPSCPTPTPALELQATIEAQRFRIDVLEKNLELVQRELDVARAEINTDINARFLPFTILGVIIAAFGLTSLVSIVTKLRQVENSLVVKMKETLEQKSIRLQEILLADVEENLRRQVQLQLAERLQQIDPTNAPVHLPRGLEKERERLMRFGFKNIIQYEKLDSSHLNGCVIIHVNSENMKGLAIVKEFRDFIQANRPDPDKVGFLFYNTSDQPFPTELLRDYPVTDYSTSITTLGQNALLILRNLIR